VNDEDYDQAAALLKTWQSPNVPRNSTGLSKTLEHPWVVGVSPAQIAKGLANWSGLSGMNRVKVLGGVIIYASLLLGLMAFVASKF
jgi:hypothetical protein